MEQNVEETNKKTESCKTIFQVTATLRSVITGRFYSSSASRRMTGILLYSGIGVL